MANDLYHVEQFKGNYAVPWAFAPQRGSLAAEPAGPCPTAQLLPGTGHPLEIMSFSCDVISFCECHQIPEHLTVLWFSAWLKERYGNILLFKKCSFVDSYLASALAVMDWQAFTTYYSQ